MILQVYWRDTVDFQQQFVGRLIYARAPTGPAAVVVDAVEAALAATAFRR
jgi:hypothetical protein